MCYQLISHVLARCVSLSFQACSFQARLGLAQTVLVDGRFEPAQLDTGQPPAGQMRSIITLHLDNIPNAQG